MGSTKNEESPILSYLDNQAYFKYPSFTMIKKGGNGIPFYQFENLESYGEIVHGIFTRNGGISSPPFHTLNVSFLCGDQRENVLRNRNLIMDIVEMEKVVSGSQAHGNQALVVRELHDRDNEIDGFDALITNTPGIALLVKQADCQAILMYDPQCKVIGNIHCGWRGNAHNIIKSTIGVMKREFGCQPSNLLACITPSLGPCCGEFLDDNFPEAFEQYRVSPYHFDFWRITIDQLKREGLKEDNIEVARVCTSCNSYEFFSYRVEKITGRFGAVIGLK